MLSFWRLLRHLYLMVFFDGQLQMFVITVYGIQVQQKGNKAKVRISKQVFRETIQAKFSEKRKFLSP